MELSNREKNKQNLEDQIKDGAVLDRKNPAAKKKNKYDMLLELIPTYALIYRYSDGKIVAVNDYIANTLNIKKERLIGMSSLELIATEDMEKVTQKFAARKNSGQVEPYDVRINVPSGKSRIVKVTGSSIRYNKEKAALLTLTDITETVYDKVWFDELFNNSPLGIVFLNHANQVLRVNPGFEKLFGYRFEEIHGANLDEKITPKHEMKHSDELSEKIYSGVVDENGIRHNKRGDPIPVRIQGMKVDITGMMVGAIVMYADMTETVKAQDELKRIITVLGHDLKAPLQGVSGFSEILSEDASILKPHQIKQYADYINESSKNMNGFINRILEWSRIKNSQYVPVPIDLKELVKSSIEYYWSNIVQKKITVYNTVTTSRKAYADPNALDAVARNLLSNALKYTDENGQIFVGADDSAEGIRFYVRDTGVGMEQDVIDKILRGSGISSSPGTRDERGSGFGLSLVNEYVKRSGGSLKAQSEKGKGSIFSFTLPYAADDAVKQPL